MRHTSQGRRLPGTATGMRVGAIVVAIVACSACSSSPTASRISSGQLIVEPVSSPPCVGANAAWSRLRRDWVCAHHGTPDAGRPCKSSDECEGYCVTTSRVPAGSEGPGACSPQYVWPGCAQQVEDGLASYTICD
jgi:hypothetical protein